MFATSHIARSTCSTCSRRRPPGHSGRRSQARGRRSHALLDRSLVGAEAFSTPYFLTRSHPATERIVMADLRRFNPRARFTRRSNIEGAARAKQAARGGGRCLHAGSPQFSEASRRLGSIHEPPLASGNRRPPQPAYCYVAHVASASGSAARRRRDRGTARSRREMTLAVVLVCKTGTERTGRASRNPT